MPSNDSERRIVAIDGNSPYLADVMKLWRANSECLGFFTRGAFDEYASDKRIIVALDSGSDCVGYILYRIVRDKTVIVHLCIAEAARGRGHGGALLNQLITATKRLRGISLRCRRDFPAYALWPQHGFVASKEFTGRGKDRSAMTQFFLDYNKVDLFHEELPTSLVAAIDTNIFLDLIEGRNEESQGLQADWLEDSVTLAITEESFNEVDRNSDPELRRQRRGELSRFLQLRSSREKYDESARVLLSLFPRPSSEQDRSDFRQLVRALAGGADAFVTRDEELLEKSDEIYVACGLSVLRPSEMIAHIDELLRDHEYQHADVAGTKHLTRRRISEADGQLLDAIRGPNEHKHELRDEVNRMLSDPTRFQCVAIRDRSEAVMAFYAVESVGPCDRIAFMRTCSDRLAGTLARSILAELIRLAVKNDRDAIFVNDRVLNNDLCAALADLGFVQLKDGWVKLVLRGIRPSSTIAAHIEAIGFADARIGTLTNALRSPLDPDAASNIEHLISPGKIEDADVPTFIVPIWPEFALELFDSGLASQTLYGAEVELALNPESVYYRSTFHPHPKFPGRILWYVSQKDGFEGTMSIRACSRVAEIRIDKPSPLYRRFRRLGVYGWKDVLNAAGWNVDGDAMAIRFHDTELLQPIKREVFLAVLKRHGITTNNLVSPVRISREAFNEIYTIGIGSSSIR